MLKKRILILSGKIYRGVLKLTNLEASYLEIELTTHFLPSGSYIFVLKIGDFVEKLHFNGEKLYRKIPFNLPFDKTAEAAIIETDPFAVLMSASSEKELSLSFEKLLQEYINFNAVAQTVPSKTAAKKTTELKDGLHSSNKNQSTETPLSEPVSDSDKLKANFKKTLEEELKKPIASEKSFFDGIKESVTEFFEKYPPYEELSAVVPSSKWVKVDTEDTFYVVGLLFNTSGITHICYGIPGEYSVKPSSEILTEWLPLNPEEWDKSGFWMIYQNAETGQI
jgi:hypothetical protein